MQYRVLIVALVGFFQLGAALPLVNEQPEAAVERRAWLAIGGGSCVKGSCYDRSVEAEDEIAVKARAAAAEAELERRAWLAIGGGSCVKGSCYDRSVEAEDEMAVKA